MGNTFLSRAQQSWRGKSHIWRLSEHIRGLRCFAPDNQKDGYLIIDGVDKKKSILTVSTEDILKQIFKSSFNLD